MGLGRVHMSERLCCLLGQDAVGEHARRVPHAHCRCSSGHVCHKPSDVCTLRRVAPVYQRHSVGRMQTCPLCRGIARQYAAARGKGERTCISTLREPARCEQPEATCAASHHVS